MTADTDVDPIDALERLGLPNYEARVFVALQKLGTGSAKEVSTVADVPQSQVYGTAESLAERGLLEIQETTPKTYRPVPIEEARDRLRERFERSQERAFEYLESVKGERSETPESEAGVWRLSGAAAIESRTVELIDGATRRIIYGTNPAVGRSEAVEERLLERAREGIDVVLLDEAVDSSEPPETLRVVTPAIEAGTQAGRLLVVDDDTILMSVSEDGTETAIWSANSGFGAVLVPLVEDAIAPESPP
ncbi:MAG: TrmB family transcriptional regulator [Halanaeroarchaeum sp.]